MKLCVQNFGTINSIFYSLILFKGCYGSKLQYLSEFDRFPYISGSDSHNYLILFKIVPVLCYIMHCVCRLQFLQLGFLFPIMLGYLCVGDRTS